MEARQCVEWNFSAHRRTLLVLVQVTACLLVFVGISPSSNAQMMMPREFVANTQNFIVFASSPEWAAQVAQVAEKHRSELAKYWLGSELPPWPERCPVHVQASDRMAASGETRYLVSHGRAGGWTMVVNGTPERVLDSVLPHEITHTIFATHLAGMNKYMPRWADEGACTTVEHNSEKQKHIDSLQRFLRTGRGLAFNEMFRLKKYPDPILPLYAQGHSAVQFLLDQGGPRTFMAFIEQGMSTEDWNSALRSHYHYETIGEFQTLWNKWLKDGSPESIIAYSPKLQQQGATVSLASNSLDSSNATKKGEAQIGIVAASTTGIAASVLPSDPLSLAHNNGTNWYQRRLREVAGSDNIDSGNLPSVNTAAVAAPRSASHPQHVQSSTIEVLDWGDSAPVQGIGSTRQPVVPPRTVPPRTEPTTAQPTRTIAAPRMVPIR